MKLTIDDLELLDDLADAYLLDGGSRSGEVSELQARIRNSIRRRLRKEGRPLTQRIEIP